MLKKLSIAVAFAAGIGLASTAAFANDQRNPASAPDPNCPTCTFVTGKITFYGVGVQCTWIQFSNQIGAQGFTTNADTPAFFTMSDLLVRAAMTHVPVTIEHDNRDNGPPNTPTACGSVLNGTRIMGASILP